MGYTFGRRDVRGAVSITPDVYEDERGFFIETFSREAFAEAGINVDILRQGHSLSQKGVLRGLHFQQSPHEEALLVRCLSGEIYDVVVDIRESSPTFGEYTGMRLSAENNRMMYVPEGCAHGYVVESDQAEVKYSMTAAYSPESEAGIRWNDPELDIDWPVEEPIVSDDDSRLPTLRTLKEQGKTLG